jgi:DNA primase
MRDWVNFDAVKAAVSLEKVLRHYQVSGLRRQRSQLQGRCPIHGGARDDSFRASLGKNAFQCFACQARGNVLDLVAAMEQCSVRQAALRLQRWFAIPAPAAASRLAVPHAAASLPKRELVREKEARNPALRFALTGVDFAHPYLRQRGIDRATAMEFGVGFYGTAGLMSGRIVIPIHNERGEIVAYAGRALNEQSPKYKLPSGFRKAAELFNLHRAIAAGSPTVIVVEGYFDCLRVHHEGFPCVVALMGSSLSPEQERALLQRFERVMLMFDGDAAGRTASQVIHARLAMKCRVVVIRVPDGTQPDQLPSRALEDLLSEAKQG